jgi:acyl-coenzyme A synthetase/AMP-(fatty) acid ligase
MTKTQATLPALIEKSTLEHQNNEAVDGTSYAELHDLTDRYVAGLTSTGISKGDAVCLFFASKSVHAVALALAIMRLGAAYVPLSSTFPEERLSTQCRAIGSAVKLLLHGEDDVDRSRAEAVGGSLQVPVGSIDSVRSEDRDTSDHSSWEDLALVLFTSGSTGSPKATGYRHKQLVSAIEACATAFDMSSETRVCHVAPFVWDVGNLDIFGPLLRGGAVCFAHDLSGPGIAQTVAEKKCTSMVSPSSLLQTIPIEALAKLEVLVSGGESTSPAQFREWSKQLGALSNTRLLNGYGLTETGIANIAWECPRDLPEDVTNIPLGTPFGDNTVTIDEHTKEIVISGPQVTEGYIGVKSTAFVAPPSVYSQSHWTIRTGDVGWKDQDGLIYTKGRTDDRLSIFALRIEQAETEAAALKVPEIDFAHLFVHELGEGSAPSLVLAYHVADAPPNEGLLSGSQYAEHADTHERRLREQMECSMPEYQRPSAYVPLGSIPRTISQKKDAKRIASLAAELHKCGLVEFAPFQLAF